nr:tripartite tricarboxylate transporter substrate binding protein [Pseudomonas sp.]
MKTKGASARLKASVSGLLLAGVLMGGVYSTSAFAQETSKTTWRPVNGEFIVPAGPGAALDSAARMIVQLLHQHGLVDDMIVVNRPGGNSAIGLNVLDQHVGDGSYVMSFASSLLNNQIIGALDRDYTDYTPIATLLDEYVAVVVSEKSPYKNIDDLIQALKKNPGALNIGVAASVGNHIHVGFARPLKEAGVDISKLTIIPYKSSAESMTALIGGHVDVVGATTPNLVAPIQAGSIRALAVGAPKRLTGPLADTPTWIEEGINIVPISSQGLLGPKGMTPEQLAYWTHALDIVVATKEWQDLMMRNHWSPNYLGPEETRKYREQEFAHSLEILSDLGLAKKQSAKR